MTIDPSGVSQGAGAPGKAAAAGNGVIRIYVILSAPGAGLTAAEKSALSSTLGDIKNTGVLQAFLRFYYQDPLSSKANAADTVAKIGADINAAKAIVGPYVDIMPFIQAGFLGPWDEWWGGDLEGGDFGGDQQLRTLKTGVVNALKSAFPTSFVQLRYPRDIATYYADDPQIAFHDDSVLAGDDDGGTFNATKQCPLWPDGDPGKQRAWIKQRSTRFSSINAGEASEVTPDVSCASLLAYLSEYRISVFNSEWPSVVTKCAGTLKQQLSWSGPLAPSGPNVGGGGGSGGVGGTDPTFGTELGCWATDQRPWQLCNPKACDPDRCRRAAAETDCTMYRAAACKGSWPPPGYPGEETLSDPSTGGSGNAAGAGGSANVPNAGVGGSATSLPTSAAGGQNTGGNAISPTDRGGQTSTPDPSSSAECGVET